jgi:tetraacyldisaccharide 4'-kinase
LRFLLFPFSIIFFCVTSIRNFLYDKNILKSYIIPTKSICIGNLSLGGTGKSPMTMYLIEKLISNFKIDTLSRGYGRKTKGYLKVNQSSNSEDVGDEPLMFFNRFKEEKNLNVHVCESRTEGVKKIIENSNLDIILLDDAFQHRKVKLVFRF